MIRFLLILSLTLTAFAGQEAKQLKLQTGETVDYLCFHPGNTQSPTPLLLFLHGGGESGSDLNKVKTHGPPAEIEKGRKYPFIVISPLNPDKKGFWDEDRLARFLDALEKEISFDKSRLYLAGMSRGGYGAYRLTMENPKRFAAVMVLCGAAPTPYAKWLGDTPIHIIHGQKDTSIPVEESVRMTRAIAKAGGNVSLTIDPQAGHDVWTKTFANDETQKWFLKHRR